MGKKKETTTVVQETKPTPTPEESEFNKLQLELARNAQPGLLETQKRALDLTSLLLQGSQLPGAYGDLYGGINPQVTQDIVNQSLSDIAGQANLGGFLDSGVRAAISGRLAADIRNQAEMFNISQRTGLMSLGLTGQAQAQQPIAGFTGQLSSRLPGLRTTNFTGTTTTKGMNPFLESFQKSLGQSMGTFSFGGGKPFSWGGGA